MNRSTRRKVGAAAAVALAVARAGGAVAATELGKTSPGGRRSGRPCSAG